MQKLALTQEVVAHLTQTDPKHYLEPFNTKPSPVCGPCSSPPITK